MHNLSVDILAVICSSVVSVATVITTMIISINQSNTQKKIKSMEFYFQSKLEAYTNLHKTYTQALIDIGEHKAPEVQTLQAYAEIATMLSTNITGDSIQEFCSLCIKCVNLMEKDESIDQILDKLVLEWDKMSRLMQQEMQQYSYIKIKKNKII